MKAIQQRLSEVPPQDVQKAVYKMASEGEIETSGAKKSKLYFVSSKKNK